MQTHRSSTAAPSAGRGNGTGFAYCPPPTRRSDWAYRAGRVYTPAMIALVVFSCGGGLFLLAFGMFQIVMRAR